jgi:hypothetical protein
MGHPAFVTGCGKAIGGFAGLFLFRNLLQRSRSER